MTVTEAAARSRFAPRTAPAEFFAGREWAVETAPFRALAHRFQLRSQSREIGDYLGYVLSGLADPAGGGSVSAYSVLDRGEQARRGRWTVYFGDQRVSMSKTVTKAISMVLWHINQEAVRATDTDMVVLHASAAELDGVGVVLPAPMESGKTTTVAGLIGAGFRYVTDEAVAISTDTGWVTPFAKPLSIDHGSWEVLSHLQPATVLPAAIQWHVPAEDVRSGSTGDVMLPRLIVSPRYRLGAETVLTPLGRAQMVVLLAESTFHFPDHGARNFAALADLARRSDCYTLTIGDLDEAVALVTSAVRTIAAREAS